MPQGEGFYYIATDSAARGDTTRRRRRARRRAGRWPPGRRWRGGNRPEKVVQWLPPFGDKDIKVLYQHTGAMASAVFTDDAQTLFVATNNAGTGEIFAVKLSEPTKRMSIVRQRGWTPAFTGGGRATGFPGGGGRGGGDDTLAFYTNPGSMLTKRGANGGEVAVVTRGRRGLPQGDAVFARLPQDSAARLPRQGRDCHGQEDARVRCGHRCRRVAWARCSTTMARWRW